MTLGPQHRRMRLGEPYEFLKRIGVLDVYVCPGHGFALTTRTVFTDIYGPEHLAELREKVPHPMWEQLATIAELMNLWD